jgi:hypothetical protein
MKENGQDQYEYYTDISFSNLDVNLIEKQVTTIIATAFALVISVTEFVDYLKTKKNGEHLHVE